MFADTPQKERYKVSLNRLVQHFNLQTEDTNAVRGPAAAAGAAGAASAFEGEHHRDGAEAAAVAFSGPKRTAPGSIQWMYVVYTIHEISDDIHECA